MCGQKSLLRSTGDVSLLNYNSLFLQFLIHWLIIDGVTAAIRFYDKLSWMLSEYQVPQDLITLYPPLWDDSQFKWHLSSKQKNSESKESFHLNVFLTDTEFSSTSFYNFKSKNNNSLNMSSCFLITPSAIFGLWATVFFIVQPLSSVTSWWAYFLWSYLPYFVVADEWRFF